MKSAILLCVLSLALASAFPFGSRNDQFGRAYGSSWFDEVEATMVYEFHFDTTTSSEVIQEAHVTTEPESVPTTDNWKPETSTPVQFTDEPNPSTTYERVEETSTPREVSFETMTTSEEFTTLQPTETNTATESYVYASTEVN